MSRDNQSLNSIVNKANILKLDAQLGRSASRKVSLIRLRALAPQLGLLVLLPHSTHGRTNLGGGLALAEHTTRLLARAGHATHFTVLLRRVADPVHARVVADGLVHRVN